MADNENAEVDQPTLSLSDEIGKAFDEAEPEFTEEVAEAAPSEEATETPKDDQTKDDKAAPQERDEHGKFKAKTDETKEPDDKDKVEEVEQSSEAKEAVSTGTQDEILPPETWKGGAKIRWDKLPKVVQQEIRDDYQRIGEMQGKYSSLEQVIAPHEQSFNVNYGSVQAGIKNLLDISAFANQDAPAFIQWFAQNRGVNLAQLTQGQAQGNGEAQRQAPHPLQQEVQQLRNDYQGLVAQQTSAQQAQFHAQIQSFANDVKAHPYFSDVRQDMAVLIDAAEKSGRRMSLDDAYDKAIWANPTVRAQLLESQRQEKQQQESAHEQERVANAKKASVSINGSPSGDQPSENEPAPTLEAEVRRNLEAQLGSRI